MPTDAPLPQDRVVTPPGWYVDGTGSIRWWDGYAWTAAVDTRGPDRTWAVLAHVSVFVIAVIGPLVIRLTAGRDDLFVRHHATEALNAQIWFVVVWLGIMGPFQVAMFTSMRDLDTTGPPTWIFVLFLLALAVGIAFLAFTIRAAVQASRGIWWRYPLPFRFVRGSVRR